MASLYLVGNGIEQAVENLPWVPAMRGIIGNDLTTKLNLGGVSLMPLAAILVIHRGVVELVPGLKDLNALGERVLELGLRPDQW